jgi:hypothetical protein
MLLFNNLFKIEDILYFMKKERIKDSRCKSFFKKYYGYVLLLILITFLIYIILFNSNPFFGRGLFFIFLGLSGIIVTYSDPFFMVYNNNQDSLYLSVLGERGVKWMLYIIFILLILFGIFLILV